MKKKKNNKNYLYAIPYGVFMFIFIVLPLFILFVYSFTKRGTAGTLTTEFTFKNYAAVFTPIYLKVLGRSIWLGIVSTIICFLIGYPTAYFLANKKYNKSKMLIMLFIIPMWMNFLLRTLATKAFFNSIHFPLGIGAIIIGMTYNFLPFMVIPIYNSITKIDNSLYEAAIDLGASSFKTFIKVVLPLSKPGILSGITMVFTPTITTYVISDMLSNRKVALIGNMIDLNIVHQNYNVASAISFIILIFIFASMVLLRKFDQSTNEGGLN